MLKAIRDGDRKKLIELCDAASGYFAQRVRRDASAALRGVDVETLMPALLGCIADDLTGGTDLAGILVKNGMRTVQMIGVPDGSWPDDADAVVVALKSRTSPVGQAVSRIARGLAMASSRRMRTALLQILLDVRLNSARATSGRWPMR